MCGLIGIYSAEGTTNWNARKSWFTQALRVGDLRGEHGTGLFMIPADWSVKRHNSVVMYKRALCGPDFVQTKKFERALQDLDHYKFAVGHNRLATRGKIADETSHPFSVGNIWLAHNGSISTVHGGLKGLSEYEVDSEWMASAFDKHGYKKVLENITGAFAVIWYDKSDDKLRMVRNDERSLCFAKVKDEDTFLATSEVGMLRWLAARNGFELNEPMDVSPGKVVAIDANMNVEISKVEFFRTPPVQPIAHMSHERTNHRVPKTHTHSSYTPSQRSIQRFAKHRMPSDKSQVDEALKKLGLTTGQWIEFSFDKVYVRHSGSRHGRLTGAMVQNPFFEVCSYNVNTDKFDGKFFLKGRLEGLELDDADWHTIVVNTVQETAQIDPSYVAEEKAGTQSGKEIRSDQPLGKERALITVPRIRQDEDDLVDDMVMGPNCDLIPVKEFEELTQYGCAFCSQDINPVDADEIYWTNDKRPLCIVCTTKQDEPPVILH